MLTVTANTTRLAFIGLLLLIVPTVINATTIYELCKKTTEYNNTCRKDRSCRKDFVYEKECNDEIQNIQLKPQAPVETKEVTAVVAERQRRVLTLDEIKEINHKYPDKHKLIVIHGKVYDVNDFLDPHPGGRAVLLSHVGTDASDAYDDIGHSEGAVKMKDKYYVGEYQGESSPPESTIISLKRYVDINCSLLPNGARNKEGVDYLLSYYTRQNRAQNILELVLEDAPDDCIGKRSGEFYNLMVETFDAVAKDVGFVRTGALIIREGSVVVTADGYYQNQARANNARLALQGSLSAFMDHGSCLINWEDKLSAQASTNLGGNWSESGDTETRTVLGGFKLDAGKSRYCVSFDADASNELSKRNDSNGSNEVDVTQLKGTAALKIGLLRGEAKKQTAFLTDWYTVYSYVSYGRGHSLTKDEPDGDLTRTEANAWQVAGGIGFQAQGKICGRYDINAGYYSGQSDADSRSGGSSPTISEGDTNGGTFSFSVDCPLKNYPIYWNAKVRHDTDDDESSTNYGIGVGYNITDNMRFEIDWERTHIKDVQNKTINANFIYDFFKR